MLASSNFRFVPRLSASASTFACTSWSSLVSFSAIVKYEKAQAISTTKILAAAFAHPEGQTQFQWLLVALAVDIVTKRNWPIESRGRRNCQKLTRFSSHFPLSQALVKRHNSHHGQQNRYFSPSFRRNQQRLSRSSPKRRFRRLVGYWATVSPCTWHDNEYYHEIYLHNYWNLSSRCWGDSTRPKLKYACNVTDTIFN